jgi:hypothetical protein
MKPLSSHEVDKLVELLSPRSRPPYGRAYTADLANLAERCVLFRNSLEQFLSKINEPKAPITDVADQEINKLLPKVAELGFSSLTAEQIKAIVSSPDAMNRLAKTISKSPSDHWSVQMTRSGEQMIASNPILRRYRDELRAQIAKTRNDSDNPGRTPDALQTTPQFAAKSKSNIDETPSNQIAISEFILQESAGNQYKLLSDREGKVYVEFLQDSQWRSLKVDGEVYPLRLIANNIYEIVGFGRGDLVDSANENVLPGELSQ